MTIKFYNAKHIITKITYESVRSVIRKQLAHCLNNLFAKQ